MLNSEKMSKSTGVLSHPPYERDPSLMCMSSFCSCESAILGARRCSWMMHAAEG